MANQAQQQQQAQQPGNHLALVKKDTVDVVAAKVRQFQERGEIVFPANYSPENAMKSAWLAIQEAKDKADRPALEVCTKNSIANALLNMVVQGLTPAKKQGYFIVYGQELTFQRSYFGTMAVTKMLTGAEDIVAQVVYEGDSFEYEIDARGRKHLKSHVQKLGNIDNAKIQAAYCNIIWPDGRTFMDVMTFDQIKAAWKQSKMKPVNDNGDLKAGSMHQKFTTDMAIKTVVNRACKYYLNTSDDSGLILEHFRATDEAAEAAVIEEEITTQANGEIIDVDPLTGEIGPTPEEQPAAEVVDEAPQAAAGPGF
ncbi:MAG: recombinase RecT [Thermoleophilia bacterium]|nr:recombinase RecT [Thermoleophilia bacterium]